MMMIPSHGLFAAREAAVMHCGYAVMSIIPGIMQNVLTFLQMITTSEAYFSMLCQPFVLVPL